MSPPKSSSRELILALIRLCTSTGRLMMLSVLWIHSAGNVPFSARRFSTMWCYSRPGPAGPSQVRNSRSFWNRTVG